MLFFKATLISSLITLFLLGFYPNPSEARPYNKGYGGYKAAGPGYKAGGYRGYYRGNLRGYYRPRNVGQRFYRPYYRAPAYNRFYYPTNARYFRYQGRYYPSYQRRYIYYGARPRYYFPGLFSNHPRRNYTYSIYERNRRGYYPVWRISNPRYYQRGYAPSCRIYRFGRVYYGRYIPGYGCRLP
ncbi:MAG: hypothetical protein AAGG80_00380 [Pseudomonadota bacterium]